MSVHMEDPTAAVFDEPEAGRPKLAETTQQEVVHAITAGIPTKVAGIEGTGMEAEA